MSMLSGPNSPHRPTLIGVLLLVLVIFAVYHFGVVKRMG